MFVRSGKRLFVLIAMLGLVSLALMAYSAGGEQSGASSEAASAASEDAAQPSGPWFTEEQARRGAAQYNVHCAACHGASLEGVIAPSLAGGEFYANWSTAGELYGFFSVAMPPTSPGGLGAQVYTDILAHILHFNGFPAGDTELPADPGLFEQIRIERQQ